MLLVLLVDVAICVVTDAVVCGEASDVNGEDESEGGAVSVAMTAVADWCWRWCCGWCCDMCCV